MERLSKKGMDMKPKFSGHDTFALRYGWLYKAVNLLINKSKKSITSDDFVRDAIVTLGVGKNMVNAIRYWAEMTGVMTSSLVNSRSQLAVADLGRFLFEEGASKGGADPYLEKTASIWLLHYRLNASTDLLTSYRYFFNYCNFQSFEKSKLVDEIVSSTISLTGAEAGKRTTVKKDVDCFLHTYSKKSRQSKTVDEDHFSSPLSELGLVTEVSGGFCLSELTDRASLPTEVFAYALCRFLKDETAESGVNTIDFDSLLSKPCSPGRIFRLSEQGLSNKLDDLTFISNGKVTWTDSLGLRQIMVDPFLKEYPAQFLDDFYGDGYVY